MAARETNRGREPTDERSPAGEEEAVGPHPDGPTDEDRRRFEELKREVFGPRCC